MRTYSRIGGLMVAVVFLLGGMVAAPAAEPVAWQGTVTAVNSNGNREGRSFTATDAEGHVKIFYISTLEHLNAGDRVELHYIPSVTFPLKVTRIRFLPPANS